MGASSGKADRARQAATSHEDAGKAADAYAAVWASPAPKWCELPADDFRLFVSLVFIAGAFWQVELSARELERRRV